MTPLASAAALALACSAAPLAQAGDYGWSDGTFSSTGIPTLLTIDDTLTLSCPGGSCGAKMLNVDLQNNGYVFAHDDLRFYQGNTLTNRWQVELHGDVGLLDTYGGNLFVNQGSLVKAAGSGTSWVTVSSTHSASALVDAASGTLNFGAGTASFASGATLLAAQGAGIVFSGGTAAFADGVRFAGAGQYTMAASASFGGAVAAQNIVFRDATWNGGDGSATGHATLASDAAWAGGGSFSGRWQVAAGSTLALQGSGAKYIGQSSSLVNDGSIAAADHLRLYYFSSLVNNGSYRFDGDVGIHETYGAGSLRNNGTLVKTAGSGSSAINAAYSGSGSVDAQTGTIEFGFGNTRFEDGSEFKGAGTVLVSHDASFAGKIRSQNLLLTNGTWTGGDGSADGSASSQAQLDGRATWAAAGTLAGRWQIAPQSTLTLAGGSGGGAAGTKYIGQSATLTNDGSVEAGDHLRFFYFSKLVNNGSWRLDGDVGLYETYGNSRVANRGELVKTAGNGTSAITVGFDGGAASRVDVRQGGIDFQAGDHTFASGAAFNAAAGTTLSFSGGTSRFADGVQFDGAGQYTVANSARFLGAVGAQHLLFKDGSWAGGDGSASAAATLTSNAAWAGAGTLAGLWRTAAGTTLTLAAGGTKTLGQSATLTNDGSVQAGDDLRFFYFSSLVNNGSWRFDGDVGLYETYGNSSVSNGGTLSKVAGTGSSVISVAFSNRGTIDTQTGSIEFNAGNANFEDGTRLTGAGVVRVSGDARFNGSTSAQNLVLANGSWTGGDGSAGGAARLDGTARWEGSGTLAGNWQLAERSTLTLAGGGSGTKTIAQSATLTNLGTIEAQDHLQLFYFSTLVNRGSYHLDGDVGLYDNYGYSQVVNEGSIVKTAGSGSSAIAVAFTNLGSVAVRSGSIALPADFSNAGWLTGSGSFATNRLTNEGHVGPSGSSTPAVPATLTIAGHFSQTAAGTLDIGLLDAARSDRLVVQGDVLLGGTLALHCLGACSFAAGDDVLVLDGSGSLSGSFASVSLSGFANDSGSGSFDLVYDLANADVWLHATSNVASAVPEPSPYALLLAGIGVIGWLARRQR